MILKHNNIKVSQYVIGRLNVKPLLTGLNCWDLLNKKEVILIVARWHDSGFCSVC